MAIWFNSSSMEKDKETWNQEAECKANKKQIQSQGRSMGGTLNKRTGTIP